MTLTDGPERPGWTFLTNHAHVLLTLARRPDARLRDVADVVGITERAVQAIVTDLEAAGYLERSKVGRRNTYTINRDGYLRHPAERFVQVAGLIDLMLAAPPATAAGPPRRRSENTKSKSRIG